MLRTFVCAAVALVLCAGISLAADKKKGEAVTGVVKKVDAATGSITVSIKNKKETTEKEFKINDATKVLVISGEDKKELTGKDGLKAEQVKEGAAVVIKCDADGKVIAIQVGTPKKKK